MKPSCSAGSPTGLAWRREPAALVIVSAGIGAGTAVATLAIVALFLVLNAPQMLAALGRLLGAWISQAL